MSESLREYGFIGSLYCVAVGFLYQWGYWSSFNINILEYTSLTDIVNIALMPLLSSFAFVCLGAVIGHIMFPHKALPTGGGRESAVGIFLNKHIRWVLALYALIPLYVYTFGPVHKWTILAVLIGPPIALALQRKGFLRDIVSHDGVNTTILGILCSLPLYAYGDGRLEADWIIRGHSYRYIAIETDKTKIALAGFSGVDTNTKLRFLGFMNNYVFLMPLESKTVIVAKFDSLDPIALQKYPKPEPTEVTIWQMILRTISLFKT